MRSDELFYKVTNFIIGFMLSAFVAGLFYNGYQQTVRDSEHEKLKQSLEITQQAFLNIAHEHKALLKVLAGKVEIHSKDTKEIILPNCPIISEQYYEYIKGVFECGDTYAITIHSNLAEMLCGDMDSVLFKYYTEENLENLKEEIKNGILTKKEK